MQPAIVNGDRLWNSLQALGVIGLAPQRGEGLTRLSLSNEDLLARNYVTGLMEEAGLSCRVDEAGNLIGRLEGERPDLAVVAVGSHVDTVIQAGMFDGALGVLAGIEALRTVKEQGLKHLYPLEIICFTDEEGVRFGVGYLGSRAMAGGWRDEWLSASDAAGSTLGEAFQHAGFHPYAIGNARRSPGEFKAYVELHIEQGRVLETAGVPVGVARGIYGHVWLEVILTGSADHAGTTPMNIRHDPLSAAAECLLALEENARASGGVTTVGTISALPGAINVIPGEARFTVDIRHGDPEVLQGMELWARTALSEIARKRGVHLTLKLLDGETPVRCSTYVTSIITAGCQAAGVTGIEMECGAGHDASAMASLTETGLILVRSRAGISHHPAEWSSPQDCAAGANVLLQTLLQLAGEQQDLSEGGGS